MNEDLFRIAFGEPESPAVAAWFDARQDEPGYLARHWFQASRDKSRQPDVTLACTSGLNPALIAATVPEGVINRAIGGRVAGSP